MKREILFRGKRVDNGQWVEGGIIQWNGSTAIVKHIQMLNSNWSTEKIKVIPKSVGQFTGLLDKNGTRIFEGNILSEKWKVIVIFSNIGGFMVKFTTNPELNKPVSLTKYLYSRIKAGCLQDCEIIGNIYDK